MAVFLICEGHQDGVDNRILNALVIQFHNLTVEMAPSGGSGGLGAVRAYLESRPTKTVAISVEDRDYFRTQTQAHSSWANASAKGFVWRRHEIENYLLHPRVVLALLDDYRVLGIPWAAALPASEAGVLALLGAVASPLLENHTGEVLSVELLRQATSAGNLQFGPRYPAQPGSTAPGQALWVPALQQEAARLCGVCSAAAALQCFEPSAITARYQDLLNQFSSPAFLTSGTFLIDMGGHELISALAAHLRTAGAPNGFNDTFLENELLRVLALMYQPEAIYQPDDFQELAAILSRY